MKSRFLHVLLPVLVVGFTGCDSDEDGLSNKLEKEFGTDPELADTDGDGLNDLKEYNLGTDGTAWDSDGDTYGDYDEVQVGTDPTDAESRIYTGYWPYNPNKDSIVDPGFVCAMGETCGQEGEILPRFQWQDQFGELVDNYDFAMQGKYIVVDVSGYWCGYCTEMALWLDYESDYYSTGDFAEYDVIRDIVNAGEVYWLTIIDAWTVSSHVEPGDAARWYEDFPNENIPIFEDLDKEMQRHADIYGYPFVILLNENMEVVVNRSYDGAGGAYTEVFDELLALFPDWEAPAR